MRYRRIEGEAVVLRQSAAEVLVLNEVGAAVLDLADGRRSVGDWIDALAGSTAATARRWSGTSSTSPARPPRPACWSRCGGARLGERRMSLARVVAAAWRENLLFSVLVELTYRCNLDCFFCYNDVGAAGRAALAATHYFRLFAELRELEVLNLTLSGGEPLAHPDFLALGARARELGFAVRIKSNGHALRGELARRVRDEVDPFLIEVSLHGATAATHDRQTRVAGSFERLLANLAELRALGLRVKLNSTLTAWNEGEIAGMFALADALGLPLQVDPEVTPRDDGGREPLAGRRLAARGCSASSACSSSAAARRTADRSVRRWVPRRRRRHRPGAGRQALRRRLLGAGHRSLRQRLPLRAVAPAGGQPPPPGPARDLAGLGGPRRGARPHGAGQGGAGGARGPGRPCSTSAPARPPSMPGSPLRIYPAAVQRREILGAGDGGGGPAAAPRRRERAPPGFEPFGPRSEPFAPGLE